MDTRCNIYVVSIDNDNPAISEITVQLLRQEQKFVRYSSAKITLYQQHICPLTYPE